MLRDYIIAPSASPWTSPILIVPKEADASGKKIWRIVVDFRKLNDVTIGDSFPYQSYGKSLILYVILNISPPLTARVDSSKYLSNSRTMQKLCLAQEKIIFSTKECGLV
jgi:hypothetical protein